MLQETNSNLKLGDRVPSLSAQIRQGVILFARLLGGLSLALILERGLAVAKDIPKSPLGDPDSDVEIVGWQPSEAHSVFVLPILKGETPQEAALLYLHKIQSSPKIASEGPREEHLPNSLSARSRFVDLSLDSERARTLLVANRSADHQAQDRRILEMSRPFTARGVQPFIVPVGAALRLGSLERKSFHQKLARHFHGLTLLGGADLHPPIYKMSLTYAQSPNELRDRLEIELFKDYLEADSGFVLGICRGAQLINVALGGQMHQDIAKVLNSPLQHGTGEAGQPNVGHTMRALTTPNGLLAKALKLKDLAHAKPIEVNSYHHQAMRVVPEGRVRVAAMSDDGVVEAIEVGDKVLGIQSHPERPERLGANSFGDAVFDFAVENIKSLAGERVGHCRSLLGSSLSNSNSHF